MNYMIAGYPPSLTSSVPSTKAASSEARKDVTSWAGFETLRDIREFRMTCMAAQVAAENPARRDDVMLRLAGPSGQVSLTRP